MKKAMTKFEEYVNNILPVTLVEDLPAIGFDGEWRYDYRYILNNTCIDGDVLRVGNQETLLSQLYKPSGLQDTAILGYKKIASLTQITLYSLVTGENPYLKPEALYVLDETYGYYKNEDGLWVHTDEPFKKYHFDKRIAFEFDKRTDKLLVPYHFYAGNGLLPISTNVYYTTTKNGGKVKAYGLFEVEKFSKEAYKLKVNHKKSPYDYLLDYKLGSPSYVPLTFTRINENLVVARFSVKGNYLQQPVFDTFRVYFDENKAYVFRRNQIGEFEYIENGSKISYPENFLNRSFSISEETAKGTCLEWYREAFNSIVRDDSRYTCTLTFSGIGVIATLATDSTLEKIAKIGGSDLCCHLLFSPWSMANTLKVYTGTPKLDKEKNLATALKLNKYQFSQLVSRGLIHKGGVMLFKAIHYIGAHGKFDTSKDWYKDYSVSDLDDVTSDLYISYIEKSTAKNTDDIFYNDIFLIKRDQTLENWEKQLDKYVYYRLIPIIEYANQLQQSNSEYVYNVERNKAFIERSLEEITVFCKTYKFSQFNSLVRETRVIVSQHNSNDFKTYDLTYEWHSIGDLKRLNDIAHERLASATQLQIEADLFGVTNITELYKVMEKGLQDGNYVFKNYKEKLFSIPDNFIGDKLIEYADSQHLSDWEYAKTHLDDIEFANEKYSVVKPTSFKEIFTDGQKLKHCVGSYLNSIIKGESMIYFLRENTNIDKPYFTIEITKNEQGLKLQQVKTLKNDTPVNNPELLRFLKDWTDKFNIRFIGY